jgi:MFS family permease
MNQIAKSSKFFLLGVLLYPILMNVIVFVSPVYSQLVYGKGTEHYQDLKHLAQVILPFFSIFYIIGSFHLSKLTGMVGKIILLSLSTILVFSYIVNIILPHEVSIFVWSRLISFDYLLLTAVLIIILNYCRSSTQVNDTV